MVRRVLVATLLLLLALAGLVWLGAGGHGARIGAPGLDALVQRLFERLLLTPGVGEPTTLPQNIEQVTGTWSGRDTNGGLWTFTFTDNFAVRVTGPRGYAHQGTAFVHWRLGLTDGYLRLPAGWTPLDVDIIQSTEQAYANQTALGAYSRGQDRLRYCFSTPGTLVRPVDEESREGVRCFELTRGGGGDPAPVAAPAPRQGPESLPNPTTAGGTLRPPPSSPAADPSAAPRPRRLVVRDFDARLTVREDGTIGVHETLDIVTDGVRLEPRAKGLLTGIWRGILGRIQGQHAYYRRMGFTPGGATLDGAPLETDVETYGRWFETYVFFGPGGLTLAPGEHRITLDYEVDRHVRFLPDRDEVFWWVFGRGGHGWADAVERIGLTVALPSGAHGVIAELDDHAWNAGAGKLPALLAEAASAGSGNELQLARPVTAKKDYLSVVVTLPKGAVRGPDLARRIVFFLRDMRYYLPVLIGLTLVLVCHLWAWSRVGRDPERRPLVPIYSPPAGLSPAVARRLRTMGYDRVSFAAALLDLAARGAVRLTGRGSEYAVERLPTTPAALPADEQILLEALCGGGTRPQGVPARCILDAPAIHRAYRAHRRHLESAVGGRFFSRNARWLLPGAALSLVVAAVNAETVDVGGGYLLSLAALGFGALAAALTMRLLERKRILEMRRPSKAAWLALLFPALLYAAAIAVGNAVEVFAVMQFMFLAPLSVMAAAHVVFFRLLPAPTTAGARALRLVEGFRIYLAAAEGDRLDRMTPPEKTPALVQEYLPYALALGVENRWAAGFGGTVDETYALPPLDVFLAALGSLISPPRRPS